MVRRSVTFWTVMFLVSHALGTFAADWSAIVKPAAKQVPRLEVLREGDTKPSICSGVVLNADAGFLLTAAHCVSTTKDQDVSLTVNGRHAEVAKSNRLLDLAVVRFRVKDEQAIALASETPPVGAEVAVIGYAFGIEKIAVQFGRVSQALNDETKTLWLNVDLIFGDSGGAVIDEQGRLVGMNSRIYSNGPAHMASAVPIEQIADFVESYLPRK